MRALTLFLLLLAMGAPLPACAAADEFLDLFARGRPTWTLDIDNDSLLLTGADGLYTSGVRVSGNYRLRERDGDGWRSAGWRVGQQLYTPKDTQLQPAQLGALDHPYTGWLYGGLYYRIEHIDGSELAFGLDLGCMGRCAGGRQTQEFLHHALRQRQPWGWDAQLDNEWGVVAQAGGRGPFLRLGRWLDLRTGVAARIGNIFADVAADLTLRAGASRAAADGSRLYGFLRGGVRAVAWDATLQGGLFANDPGRTVEPKRLTHELELGLQWQSGRWALRASVVGRGSEIRGLSEGAGGQEFARLSISYSP